MSKINWKRVVLGALLAGFVVNLLGVATWVLYLGEMEAAVGATHPPSQEPPERTLPNIIASFIPGFVGVGLYVALRPRYGSGPRTAVLAGLLCWFTVGVVPMLIYMFMFWRGPQLPASLIAVTFVTALVIILVATVAGAWVYKEQDYLSEKEAPKWRNVAAAIGLGAAVADALLHLAVYAIWISSLGTNFGLELVRYNLEAEGFRPVLFWWRIGVWLGAFAIVASSLGKGRLRDWGLLVGSVSFLLWLFRGHS